MDSQIRRDIRDMLDRIILAGGKRISRKSRARPRMARRGKAYELEGDGLRAYGLYAGRKSCGMGRRRRTGIGRKKQSPWIAHVKKYAKAHGMNYAEALKSKGVRKGYKPMGGVVKKSRKKKSL